MLNQRDCAIEIAEALVHVFEDATPEGALLVIAAGKSKEDRQGDLALAEVVADAFAELGFSRRKIEHVVDQLEGDPEVAAEPVERHLLLIRPFGDNRADAARRREQLGGL